MTELEHLRTLQWVPLTERAPTPDDANRFGDVEWWSAKVDDIWQGSYDKPREATHWRRWFTPDSP